MKYQKIFRLFLVIILFPLVNLFEVTNLKSQELNTDSINNLEKELNDVYIIGPGDILEIKFLNDKSNVTQVSVLKDGSVSVPFVGFINLNELTFNEATELIKARLSEEILFPDIQLKLIKERPIKISLIGEVKLPGIYNLNKELLNKTESSINNLSTEISSPTIIDAIIAGGGITKNANIREVDIKRKLPKSIGGYKKATIDLYKLILEGDFYQNLNLYDEDTITIKRVDKSISNQHKIFKTNIVKDKINIYLSGEVKNPGKIIVDNNTKLVQAIYKAGGPINYRANKGKVEIIRSNNNGSISIKKFKLKLKENISEESNPVLEDGDIIKISTTKIANVSDALGTVSSPLRDLLNFYSFFKIIND